MCRGWILLAALLALPLPASAVIYRWIDEDGRTHFSNRPPQAPAKDVKVVVDDDEAPLPAEAERRAARRERELEERIASLERQLAERQPAPVEYYAPPAASPPPPPYDYASPYGYSYYGAPYYYPYVIYAGTRYAVPTHRHFGHPAHFPPAVPRPARSFSHAGMRR